MIIPPRAERIRILLRIARGEERDRHVLPGGCIVEVPVPMDVRQDAIALLRLMGVRGLPPLEAEHAN